MAMEQAKGLKKLSGEERMEQAFRLSEFVRELAVVNIKEKLGPKATKRQIATALRRRLHKN